MPKPTQQEITERYQRLPETLKDALLSANIASTLFEIGKKFELTIEKIGFMAEETGYVILGLTKPDEFTHVLAGVLKTDESKTRLIAKEINQQVFFPLREALKTSHQMEISGEETQKGAIAVQKPSEEKIPAPLPMPLPKPVAEKPLEPRPVPSPAPAPNAPPRPPQPTPPPLTPPETKLKPVPPQILPATPKIPPVDLRPQAKPRPTELLPKPEIMGKGIFGAPPIINNIPKPEQPQTQEKSPPAVPQKSTPKSYDPYREPI